MDPEIKKDLDELNKSLHASNLSIKNRLLSILKDSQYVNKIHQKFYPDFELIANERCGSWYTNQFTTSCYFKSTDGHTNNWSFSTRRLNLHLIENLHSSNGLIIVDSTRRGKRIPDSLSKTIPLWIAILNKFIDPALKFDDVFQTPVETVSRYEHDRILDLLPEFYANIGQFKDLIIDKIKILRKPLRPFWIYPDCGKYPIFTGTEKFIPIILLSASKESQDGENKSLGYSYVQGAGDDHELWSRGLTPDLFWSVMAEMDGGFDSLYSLTDSQIADIIDCVVIEDKLKRSSLEPSKRGKFWNDIDINDIVYASERLSFGKIDQNVEFKNSEIINTEFNFDVVVVLDSTFKYIQDVKSVKKIYQFSLDSHSKKSSKLLRKELSCIMDILKPCKETHDSVLVLCGSGDDLSVAVVICYINYINGMGKKDITKESIRRDLIKLMELKTLNPQRATLNSINSYLMS